MDPPLELTIDVSEAAARGEPCRVAVSVHLPDPALLGPRPVVCFAFPGGGYSRRYYSFDLPGTTGGGQAGWHTALGWVFVTVDHLGVGDSTVPTGDALTYESIAAANHAAVEAVMARLADGTLSAAFPAVTGAVRVAIGQSMGGCFLIVAQGQHATFDGVGVLGFSAIHTIVPSRPGSPPIPMPWMPRGSSLTSPIVLNAMALTAASTPAADAAGSPAEHAFTWAFHFDDEDPAVVAADMDAGQDGPLPPWRSATVPACAIFMVAPGTVAAEAAAIRVPVLVATGERDVVPDPRREPAAYASAPDISVFVCPRMAHMHNFAGTREQLWARIHSWGTSVGETRAAALAAREPTGPSSDS